MEELHRKYPENYLVHLDMAGMALRLRGELQQAEVWLRRSLDSNATVRTQTVARLELAKTLDRMGRRQEALQLYEAVRSAPDVAGSRGEAQRLLRTPFRE